MENNLFNTNSSAADHSYMAAMDGFSSHIFSGSMFQSDVADHGNCRQIMHTDPLYLAYQEDDPNSNPHAENLPYITNVSFNNPTGNSSLRENLMGTSLSATLLADLLSTTTSLRENHNNTSSFSKIMPIGSCISLNSSAKDSIGSGFGPQDHKDGDSNGQLNYSMLNPKPAYDEFSASQLPSTQTSSTVHPSYLVGSFEQGWISNRSALNFDPSHGNELSLSLGSSQPSVFSLPNRDDHCSQVSYSRDYRNREKLSLCCGSSHLPASFSRTMLGSRYLLVVQEILCELAGYASEDVEEVDDSLADALTEAKRSSSSCSIVNGFAAAGSNGFPFCSGENEHERHADFAAQERLTRDSASVWIRFRMLFQRSILQQHQAAICLLSLLSAPYPPFTEQSGRKLLARFLLSVKNPLASSS